MAPWVPIAILLCGLCGTVPAQEPPSPGQDDEATDLDAVVVTARKRTESVVEVPMNISVVGTSELDNRNAVTVLDIYRTIAGGANPLGQLILRGLVGGNTPTPGTTSQFVDGIPLGFGYVHDIEQIEVLRGPQGTLWGSNAIGGTVHLRTRAPQFNDFELNGNAVAGTEKSLHGTWTRANASINIPLVDDTLAMRVSTGVRNVPGKMVNAHTGTRYEADSEFIRTQLRWQPARDLDLILGHIWVATDSVGPDTADRSIPGFYWVPILTPNPDSPWGYDVDFEQVECPAGAERPACRAADSQPVRSNPKYTIWERVDGWARSALNLFSLRADHDNLSGIMSAHYVGTYRYSFYRSRGSRSRQDMEDMARTWVTNHSKTYQTTHELRFQSLEHIGGLDWTVGFFQDRSWEGYDPDGQWQYHDTDPRSIAIFSAWNDYFEYGFTDLGIRNIAELGQALYGNPGANYNTTTLHYYARERAVFGELGYLLETGIGRFEFTGGLRRFRFEDSMAFRSSGIWLGTNGDSPYFDEAYSGRESGTRRKFSVSYMPSGNLNVYALYSEGYRPGGNNPPLPNSCAADEFAGGYQPRYGSDRIENTEVGIKASLFDRRFHVAAAIYHIDWRDTWSTIIMPRCGFSYITNTPGKSARSQGLEFESTLALTDRTMLTFNYGHTRSRLTADNEVLGAKAGDDMTMVPKYNAYLALDHEFRLLGRQTFARIDVASYGEYKSHFNTRPEDVSPAYTTVNLSGRIRLDDNLQLGVHIENLFNEQYITYRTARSRTSSRSPIHERYGNERGIAVRLDYRF